MTWLLRLLMPRTYQRTQCQHLNARAERRPPSWDKTGGGWCPECRTKLYLSPR